MARNADLVSGNRSQPPCLYGIFPKLEVPELLTLLDDFAKIILYGDYVIRCVCKLLLFRVLMGIGSRFLQG